ncbi:signal transduction histidine kinase [Rhizobium sp. BK313]|uniref:sensor histidine kinase n=1 Tax=Rhizobium sp. BK313 TaxID=2587081 RepID=UPI001414E0B9|nr:histidine kinase [Rhizobium sp. BK313]MBB3458980.1 signal transduction histidine kinase [Rhizobium sp. BK313]
MTEPIVQELATAKTLPPQDIAQLDNLLADPAFRERFPHLEIWTPNGTVAYSLSKELISRHFNPPLGLTQALSGEVAVYHADLTAPEHTLRNFHTRYLEIYSPLRDHSTGRIIAVAEIHEAVLAEEAARLQWTSWGAVALVSAFLMACLFGIVQRGSRTIELQRRHLIQRAEEAEAISSEISELRNRARVASLELANLNEKFIRSIGADLHDGPSQMLGFAMLQIEQVRTARTAPRRKAALATLADALDSALTEIRIIAKALVLPEIEHLHAEAILMRAIKLHEARTRTIVEFKPAGTDIELPAAIKTCLYRFIQEGLNNAYRHADGNGQQVRCRIDTRKMEVSVHDSGRSRGTTDVTSNPGMGIHGLRQRIESLGGRLSFERRAGRGAHLKMSFDLEVGILNGESGISHTC